MADQPALAISDVFARLAARVHGGGAVIEPRLPSVFEPQPEPALPHRPGWQDDNALEFIRGSAPKRSAVNAPAEFEQVEMPARAIEPRPGPGLARQAAPLPALLTSADARGPPVASAALPTRYDTPADPPAPRNSRSARAGESREAEKAPGATRVAPRLPAEDHGALTVRLAGSPLAHAPRPAPLAREAAHALPIATGRTVSPMSDTGVESGTLVPKQQAGKPVVAPLPAARPWPARREDIQAPVQIPSEPVINITIGRIEVRAAPAAAPADRPANSKPRQQPLALADYLKQRGGSR